jgi:hypothetical protein
VQPSSSPLPPSAVTTVRRDVMAVTTEDVSDDAG